MKELSDVDLIELYKLAIEYELERGFIHILEQEMARRIKGKDICKLLY